MKVGKEEIVGLLVAVESWFGRDREAESKLWESWLAHISDRVGKVNGVISEIRRSTEMSDRADTSNQVGRS
jgi:L-seryl-tRNA(Ser) seleniumtransferase